MIPLLILLKAGDSLVDRVQEVHRVIGEALESSRDTLVTLRFAPNVLHVAVQQVDQHQTVTAQEAVPAARITRTHLVRRDVHVGVREAAVTGETLLANLNGSGSSHQAVHIGDIFQSEYFEHLAAVVADLQVFWEGRAEVEGEHGVHAGFKHRRVDHNSRGDERRGLFHRVRWICSGDVYFTAGHASINI